MHMGTRHYNVQPELCIKIGDKMCFEQSLEMVILHGTLVYSLDNLASTIWD